MEIIRSSATIRPDKLFALAACLSLGCGTAASAADVVLQQVPPLTVEQAPAYPENLARYQLGAQVEAAPQSSSASTLQLSSKSEDRNTAEAALLCGDPTVGYALNNGTTTLLVSLSKVENIDSVSFLNHGAKGSVTIATSNAKLPADSAQWHEVAQQELSSDTIKAKIGPSEAKYVRLTFNVSDSGRIAALGVYSTPTVAAFAMPRARKFAANQSEGLTLISNNLTDLHAKARAAYVSSGDDVKAANNMIDDQPGTVYNFAAADASPMAVIDLGKVTKLRRISAIYSPGHGTLDFYVLQALPAKAQGSTTKNLQFDDATLAGMQSVGSVTDDGSGRAAVDFPETAGRYVMVKWTPAEAGTAFSVAEIAAFGGEKTTENLVAANTTGSRAGGAASDGKTMLDGKDFKDLGAGKDMPEEGPAAPEEGPGTDLPNPPPFVFVPEVGPMSP
ncbi:MAG: hypothetical protein QOG67_1340 [Verrucomicrobiota bacterium]